MMLPVNQGLSSMEPTQQMRILSIPAMSGLADASATTEQVLQARNAYSLLQPMIRYAYACVLWLESHIGMPSIGIPQT
jgi:hypothetical protein